MHGWRTVYHFDDQVRRHTVSGGVGHCLLGPLAAYAFTALRGSERWPSHVEPSVMTFEAYLMDLRIERSKLLLASTSLGGTDPLS